MPTVHLTGRTVTDLTCPAGKPEAIFWADDLPGFGVRCRASGARSWLVQYRTKLGDLRKHTLGDPEHVPLGDARKEAQRLLAKARLGGDPAGEMKAAKSGITVGKLVEQYLARQKARMKARSYVELERHLQQKLKPLHGERADHVTQRAVVQLLEAIAETAPVAANRVRAAMSAMFTWGMKSALVSANPVVATFKPSAERPRDRVLTDRELALIWHAADRDDDYHRIVRLLMLTGARREEIGGMMWTEITHNADGSATWVLPAERAKNSRAHEVVLPPLAVGLLPPPRKDAQGKPRPLVFGEGCGPFAGWGHCKPRLDARIAEVNDDNALPHWTLHDLRRTFVTRLNDLGIEPHVIEALVNHASGRATAGVAGVYNRSAYGPQKRAALAFWCDHVSGLDGLKPAEPPSGENVVPLRRAV